MATAPDPGSAEVLKARLEAEVGDVEIVDGATVVASIKAGVCDGMWAPVMEAVRARAIATDAQLRWKVELDGLHATETDFTLAEARLAQQQAGKSWLALDPVADVIATHAVLIALFHTRGGMSLPDAFTHVQSLTAVTVAEAVTRYVEPRPFDSASTTSSTSASTGSNGHRQSPKPAALVTSPGSSTPT